MSCDFEERKPGLKISEQLRIFHALSPQAHKYTNIVSCFSLSLSQRRHLTPVRFSHFDLNFTCQESHFHALIHCCRDEMPPSSELISSSALHIFWKSGNLVGLCNFVVGYARCYYNAAKRWNLEAIAEFPKWNVSSSPLEHVSLVRWFSQWDCGTGSISEQNTWLH